MELIKAAVLGVVQGLTEFLPVSSSGHLILAREVLAWQLLADPHWNTVFDISVHAGTFLALLAYFWSDIIRLVGDFAASLRYGIAGNAQRRLAWLIAIGTVPAALAGVLGEDAIETWLRQTPMLVAVLLIAFGLLLWLAEWRGRKARDLADMGWGDGILVGVAQALSLAPGVSRSGITITAGLARGIKREPAARFSFLLSLPIIGGTAVHGFLGLLREQTSLPAGALPILAVGFLTAAVSGYFCIRYFLRYLQTRVLTPFVIYRLLLGIGLLVLFLRPAG